MAYDSKVRRVFIPVVDSPAVFAADKQYEEKLGLQNTGVDLTYFNLPEEPDKLAAALAQTASLTSFALILKISVDLAWKRNQFAASQRERVIAGGVEKCSIMRHD